MFDVLAAQKDDSSEQSVNREKISPNRKSGSHGPAVGKSATKAHGAAEGKRKEGKASQEGRMHAGGDAGAEEGTSVDLRQEPEGAEELQQASPAAGVSQEEKMDTSGNPKSPKKSKGKMDFCSAV